MLSFKNLIICAVVWASCCALSPQDPIISQISPERIKNIGDDVTLNCTIDNVQKYTISWGKEQDGPEVGFVVLALGEKLTFAEDRYTVTEEQNGTSKIYSLHISKLERKDLGIYQCQILMSSYKKLNAKVNLLINHPAYILEDQTPESYTVSEGNPEELFCYADGYPKPFISWKRENNALMPSGGNVYHGNSLKLKPAHRLDRGVYICISDNSIGKPHEKLIRVEVEFPPAIVAPRPKVGQVKSYGTELQCDVEGYPAPSISWHKSGKALQNGGNYRITNIATANEVTNSVVRISSVSSDDYGDYFCNATNKLGQAEIRVNLFESIIPVPTNF